MHGAGETPDARNGHNPAQCGPMPSPINDALDQLSRMQTALSQLVAGELLAQAFAHTARQQTALLAALPPRFGEVLHDQLDRLETSALFTEESCSFSQHALTDNLQLWIDKAQARLSTT